MFFNKANAARFINVKRQTLYNMVRDGRIKVVANEGWDGEAIHPDELQPYRDAAVRDLVASIRRMRLSEDEIDEIVKAAQ